MKTLLALVAIGAAVYFFMHHDDGPVVTVPKPPAVDRTRPEYVVAMIEKIHSPEDAQRHAEYFTPQGLALLTWSMEQTKSEPMTGGGKVTYAEPVVFGDTCDIGMQTKDGNATIRLLKTDHWRFHDMHLGKHEGKDLNVWLSYVKDHPYLTAWKMLWQ